MVLVRGSFLAFGLVAASGDSTVSKVVELLTELRGKVETDLKEEAALMEEYSTWCDDEQTKTSYAIKDEKRIIEELKAKIDAANAKIQTADAAIAETGPAIAAKAKETKDAEKVREDERKAFVAKEAELVEAEDMLRRAEGVLKKALGGGASLMQVQNSDKMQEVVAALGAIIDASWIDQEKMDKIKSFLETDDSLSLKQPQATVSNYESKSGGIVKTIQDMRDETVEDLGKARNAETKSRHSFEMLTQSLANEVKTLEQALAAAKANKGTGEEELGSASGDLKSTEEGLKADETYLSECTTGCSNKAAAWEIRQKDANEEMAVIDKAKEILASKVTVLAQTGMRTHRVKAADIDRRDRMVVALRRLGHKFNSFGLLQAASAAQADPFEKIRALINDMIAKLVKQAQEEADHEEMCQTELAKNTKEKAAKEAELEKYTTRSDQASAKTEQLKEQIAVLTQEIKDLDASVAEATKTRNAESTENLKVIKDNKDSAAAVAAAIKVLRDYYGGDKSEEFLQVEQPAAPSFAANKGGAADSIMGILETAQEDFTKLFMETESQEEEAVDAYKKLMQASEMSKAKKEMEVKGKRAEIDTLGVSLNQLAEDITGTNKELDAVVSALATLKKECENKAMSYEERKSRREAEIAGMKEALEILAPEEAEDFLQVSQKVFLGKK